MTPDYQELQTPLVEEAKPQTVPYVRAAAGFVAVAVVAGGAAALLMHGNDTAPAPVPPSPSAAAAQSTTSSSSPSSRLTITNGCSKDPLWIANFAFRAPFFPQDLKLPAGATHAFEIPDEGLAATRFWAKWGCDDTGSNCLIGQSGGPGEACPEEGCSPPIDSKFEATFGCLPGSSSKCAVNPSDPSQPLGPIDWWDTSQVDGWTLPYKVEVKGDCPMAPKTIDCSKLTLDACPEKEDLLLPGGPESLRLTSSADGSAVGCYAPCAKLTYPQLGQGHSFTPESPESQPFCCPTPPISPEACSKGPIEKTKFVQAVHKLCPSVYAYAYDDGVGLAQCPAGTRYDVTFYCP